MNEYYAAQKYKETSITTADSGKIVVLLYEAIDKHLTEAAILLEQNTHKVYDQINHHITKAQQIIIELMTSLKQNKDNQEFYNNLFNLYVYFNEELSQANIKKNVEKVVEIQGMVNELLESWKIAAQSIKTNPPTRTGINLSG